jgi:hypothetical protein
MTVTANRNYFEGKSLVGYGAMQYPQRGPALQKNLKSHRDYFLKSITI